MAEEDSRDRDGWIVDAGTGALIGPDLHLERELTDEELARSQTFLAEAARQGRLVNESDLTDPAVAFVDNLAEELLRELDEEEARQPRP